MRHAQKAQRIEIIALDNQVFPRRFAAGESRINVEHDEIIIQRIIVIDLVTLPHQTKSGLAVALAQQPDQFLLCILFVFVSN